MSTLRAALNKPLFSGQADKLIAASGLPLPIQTLITSVVRRSRLWRSEQADVARELIAHFTDGLAAGRTADQLIADFGDPAKSAKLIRAGKKRARPLWWQFQRRTGHVLLAFLGLLALAYIVQAIRFYTGSPTISRNYLAELNAPIIATPVEQRGYPILLNAINTLEPVPEAVSGAPNGFSFKAASPADDGWSDVAAYAKRNQPGIDLIRRAAALQSFGYIASNAQDPDFSQAMLHHGISLPESQQPVADIDLISVALPYLAALRQSSLLLNADAWLAIETGDPARAASDLVAMLGLAHHAREFPVLIGDLVALAIVTRTAETIPQLIEKHPGVLTDAHLRSLASALAAFPRDRAPLVRFDGERAMWNDVAQRIYTDDGNGDGHITAAGLTRLLQYASWGTKNQPTGFVSPLGPVAVSVIAGRKEMTDKYNHFMDRTQSLVEVPLWKRERMSVDDEIDRFAHDRFNKYRYFPLAILLPALGNSTLVAERTIQRRDATLVAIAIERHRLTHAALPSALNELVPSFLTEVPADRFDGAPLRYRRSDNPLGYVLYSIGADLDDDSGVAPVPASARKQTLDRVDPSRWRPRAVVERMKADPALAGNLPDGDWILVPAPTDN